MEFSQLRLPWGEHFLNFALFQQSVYMADNKNCQHDGANDVILYKVLMALKHDTTESLIILD